LPGEQNLPGGPEPAITYPLYGNSVYVIGEKKAEDGQVVKDAKGQAERVVERRFVETGERRAGLVVISKGLQAGEQVVSAGQLKLDNGAHVSIANANVEAKPSVE
jgi:membrane fusion protein (multidrug efflux system)